jgi:O-antigen/teichoic acid export membrane protein
LADDTLLTAAKGGGVVFAGRLFTWGMRFALAVLLARTLGAHDYGVYNLALTTGTILGAFAVLGLDAALVRYVAIFSARSEPSRLRGAIEIGLGTPALVGAVAGIVVFVGADWIAVGLFNERGLAPLLRLTSILIPLLVVNQLLASVLQGMRRIQDAVIAEQISQPLIRGAMIVGFLLLGLQALGAMLAATLAALVVTFILAAFVLRAWPAERRTVASHREPAELIRFSLPVWLSNVVNTLGGNVQISLLGILGTAAAAGIFAVANQITLLGTMFHAALVSASMPLFAQLAAQDDQKGMTELYRATSKWTFAINLPLFLVLVLFPAAILTVFGSGFVDGAPALIVMAFAGLVNAGTGTSGAILDMTGHTGLKLVNSACAVAVGIVLSVLLIPPFGIVGAAVGALGVAATLNLLRLGEVAFLLHLSPYDVSFVKPIVAGGLALALGLALTQRTAEDAILSLLVGVPAVLLVYTLAIWRLGLSADDRRILSAMSRRLRLRGSTRRRPADPARVDAPAPPTGSE